MGMALAKRGVLDGEIGRVRAVFRQGLDQKFQALIANKVLYPDGTVNGYVERFLRARTVKMLWAPGQRFRKAG